MLGPQSVKLARWYQVAIYLHACNRPCGVLAAQTHAIQIAGGRAPTFRNQPRRSCISQMLIPHAVKTSSYCHSCLQLGKKKPLEAEAAPVVTRQDVEPAATDKLVDGEDTPATGVIGSHPRRCWSLVPCKSGPSAGL